MANIHEKDLGLYHHNFLSSYFSNTQRGWQSLSVICQQSEPDFPFLLQEHQQSLRRRQTTGKLCVVTWYHSTCSITMHHISLTVNALFKFKGNMHKSIGLRSTRTFRHGMASRGNRACDRYNRSVRGSTHFHWSLKCFLRQVETTSRCPMHVSESHDPYYCTDECDTW